MIANELDEAKASDIVIIDLAGKTSIADYMIIASGTSARHVVSIAERVVHKLKEEKYYQTALEGKEQGDWVLIDAMSVIAHIFRPEIRTHYDLEKMWSIPMISSARV